MPGRPPFPATAFRRARPCCEPLEARALPSASVFGPFAASPPLTFAQVTHALREAWGRLVGAPTVPTSPMVLSGEGETARLEVSRPDGASSEILDLLGKEPGDGDFTTRHHLTLGYVARSVLLRDLDGDGVPELLLTADPDGRQPSQATLLLRPQLEGEGSEGEREYAPLPLALAPFPVAARDVTGDGVLDLVVTCPVTNTTWVLRGLGGGRFDEDPWLVRAVGDRPIASFLDDFNGDGKLDLVTVDSGSDDVTFYSDVASPGSTARALSSGGRHPVAALERDVNGDGIPDLVVANHDDGQVVLFLGGPGGLAQAESIPTPAQPAALASGPASQPGRVYVAFDNGEPAQWLSFAPTAAPSAGHDVLALDEPAPPPEMTPAPAKAEGKLRALSPAKLDLVPTLVRTLGNDEGSAASEAPAAGERAAEGRPNRAPPALPASGAAQEDGSPGLPPEGEAREPTAARDEEQLRLQRYLLGVEEAAAPVIPPPEGGAPRLAPGPLPTPREGAAPTPGDRELSREEGREEVRAEAPAEPSERNDTEGGRREGGLLAAARHALVLTLAAQAGLAWAGWAPRRRKGTE